MADELQLMQAWINDTLAADNDRDDPASLENLFLPFIPAAQQAAFRVWSRIFSGAAEGSFPYILIEYVAPALAFSTAGARSFGSGDLYQNGATRTWTAQGWRVTARIDKRRMAGISPIVSRIDELLSIDTSVPVSGGTILSCVRENPYQRTDYQDNTFSSIRGGDYVLIAQAA